MSRATRRRGFTLLEIMVVVLIIGTLAALAVPNYKLVRERAQVRACYANLRTIAGALEWYCADINQPYEITGDADFEKLVKGGYLQALPVCPEKGAGNYTATGGSKQAVCNFHGTINVAPAAVPTP